MSSPMIEVRMGDKPSVWTEIISVWKFSTIFSSSYSRRRWRLRNVVVRVFRVARTPSWEFAMKRFSSHDIQGINELVWRTCFQHDSDSISQHSLDELVDCIKIRINVSFEGLPSIRHVSFHRRYSFLVPTTGAYCVGTIVSVVSAERGVWTVMPLSQKI